MRPKPISMVSKKDSRQRIASYIRLHPGTSFKNIISIFDLTDGTLRYHLRYLERKGQIRSDRGKRIYYPTERLKEGNLIRIQQLLLYTIREYPGITQKELSIRIHANRLTIRSNVRILIKRELLYAVRHGKEIHHFCISLVELKKAKIMRLITKFLLDKIDEETYWDLRSELVDDK